MMRLFGWNISAHRVQTPSVPPLSKDHRAYRDAVVLVTRAFDGRNWSRRTSALPERRWRAAYGVLQMAGVVGDDGMIYCTYMEALGRIYLYHVKQEQLRKGGRYVSAIPPHPRK